MPSFAYQFVSLVQWQLCSAPSLALFVVHFALISVNLWYIIIHCAPTHARCSTTSFSPLADTVVAGTTNANLFKVVGALETLARQRTAFHLNQSSWQASQAGVCTLGHQGASSRPSIESAYSPWTDALGLCPSLRSTSWTSRSQLSKQCLLTDFIDCHPPRYDILFGCQISGSAVAQAGPPAWPKLQSRSCNKRFRSASD